MIHPTGKDGQIVAQGVTPTASSPTVPLRIEVAAARRGRGRWVLVGGGVVACLVGASVAVHQVRAVAARNETVRELPRRLVARVDFETRLMAAGQVESHSKTLISCELERLSVSNEGRVISASGRTQVLEVVPEGTRVKQGDVLCRLNSTDYEELVRTQQMKTEQARAALEQAQLSFEVAELAVREYDEGLRHQSEEDMKGQIALIESDLQRARDRLQWTIGMLGKGYVPVAQRATAERSVAQLEHQLMTNRWELRNFTKYGDSRTLKELQAEVEKRRYEVTANTQRVMRLDERLGHYRKMVDFCTIRAPRDGLVIYFVDPWRRADPLQAGVEVYQQQPLFYLPDLDRMDVLTYLHESVARKVAVGMHASIKIEGMSNRTLSGRVVSLAPLSVRSPVWTLSEEVKYVVATVQLDEAPPGLLPMMSAEVEIDLDRSSDVLAVPSEAVAFEQGRDVCYVARTDGLERRQVTVGRSNRDLLEVTQGLVEGEAVVINPAKIEAIDSLMAHSSPPRPEIDSAPVDPTPGGTGAVGVE